MAATTETGVDAMGVVLITGCSSGIGLETALAFARRGETTVATMRDPARGGRLLERADAEGLAIELIALDVRDDASVTAAVDEVQRRHGPVDVLVNNAGVGDSAPLETMPLAQAQAVFDTNVWGALRTIRAVLPGMRARHTGVVMNISSLAARVPAMPYNGVYAASKHALSAISESLSWELAPFSIRVALVEPGFFATSLSGKSWPEVNEANPYAADHAWVRRFFAGNLGGGGDPAAAADAIARIADDAAAPLHTLVGDDAVAYAGAAAGAETHEAWVAFATGVIESVSGPRPISAAGRHSPAA